jgi:hypothetical protein
MLSGKWHRALGQLLVETNVEIVFWRTANRGNERHMDEDQDGIHMA